MKETVVAGTIIVALTLVIGYHAVYVPQRAERAQVRLALREEQDYQRTQGEVATLLQEFEQLSERLSPQLATSWLINEVVQLADAAGVQLTTITPQAPQAVAGFTHLGVDLVFSASYHQLGTFLGRIEQAKPFFRLDRVDVSPAGSSGVPVEEDEVLIHMMLSTFYPPSPVHAQP
jgi:Tfp pilus assembly protein PilO